MKEDAVNPHSKNLKLIEEIGNAVTHGIGAMLSIAALSIFLFYALRQDDITKMTSLGIFGGSLILLYTASTLYHSFYAPKVKHYFKILDHSAIYILIAGTYTPFSLVLLKGVWGWTIFGTIWLLALTGIIFKLFFINKYHKLSTTIYVLMGWLILIAIKPMISSVPLGGLFWLLAGGMAYTTGVIFYLWEKLPFNHAIWHLFVLAGSICHFFSVYFYVLPE